MTRYAKTMSQAVAEVQVRELKMNDPKLNKIFDKLKKGDKIKLKTIINCEINNQLFLWPKSLIGIFKFLAKGYY